MYLSVVIPAYNEGKRILPTLKSVDEYFRKKDYEYEIIVVSDGSKDDTVSVVNNISQQMRGLRVIESNVNRGKGYVVKLGINESIGELRLFMDADNSTTIDNLDKMIPCVSEGYDVVIASIGVSGARSVGYEPFYKRFFGRAGNLIIRTVAVSGISDTQRGFKLFTAKAATDIFSRLKIERWGFDVEALAIARVLGYKIKEVPIIWNNDPDSKVGISAYLPTLLETVKIRWNLMTGNYK